MKTTTFRQSSGKGKSANQKMRTTQKGQKTSDTRKRLFSTRKPPVNVCGTFDSQDSPSKYVIGSFTSSSDDEPVKRPVAKVNKRRINVKHILSRKNRSTESDTPFNVAPQLCTPPRSGFSEQIEEFPDTPEDPANNISISPPKTPILTRSIPSQRDLEITQYSSPEPTPVPSESQVLRLSETVNKQISSYKSSVDLSVVVCQKYSTPNEEYILVKDVLSEFALIKASHIFETSTLEVGRSFRIASLGVGKKETRSSWTPLFSVIWTIGSQQRVYNNLLWTPFTEAAETDDLFASYEPVSAPIVSAAEIRDLSESKDQRVILFGTVQRITTSDLYISCPESTPLRVIMLSSFPNKLSVISTGEDAVLTFLRVYRGICTMDQFSDLQIPRDSRACK